MNQKAQYYQWQGQGERSANNWEKNSASEKIKSKSKIYEAIQKSFLTGIDKVSFEHDTNLLKIKTKKDPAQTEKDKLFMLILNTDKKNS